MRDDQWGLALSVFDEFGSDYKNYKIREDTEYNSSSDSFSIIDHMKIDTSVSRIFGTTRSNKEGAEDERVHVFVINLRTDYSDIADVQSY